MFQIISSERREAMKARAQDVGARIAEAGQQAGVFARAHKRELIVGGACVGLCTAALAGVIGTGKALVAVGAVLATDVVIGVTVGVITAKRAQAAAPVAEPQSAS